MAITGFHSISQVIHLTVTATPEMTIVTVIADRSDVTG
jgi:hypothetical protein